MTIDAMGCQKSIVLDIIDGDGDYAIAVKANQGNLYESVIDHFTATQSDSFHTSDSQYHETIDKGHGRIEIRRYWIS